MNTYRRDILTYTAPFVTWILLQSILPTTAWAYAVRTFATAIVGAFCWRNIRMASTSSTAPKECCRPFPGFILGLIVCALWIFPDHIEWYRRWLCWPLGKLPPPSTNPSPYDPAVCGWPLTIIKLIGSAFVIAPVEELFFRSFLYRWLQQRDFTLIPHSRFDLSAFVWMVFLFSLEHDRPLAAVMAGAAYGLAAIRWGLAAAIIAHVTTNLFLALHVIYWGKWAFW